MAGSRGNINLFNEAFGLNQLIAPLLWLSKTPSDSTIAIEEPEVHLHPRAQAALCELFVEIATQEQKQLILTTHSEHILMALLTAVAKGQLKPADLAVYEFSRHGDTARAERLAVNQHGQIEGGLRGFLEVDMDEIGDLIKARFQHSQR
jgi:predicted ATPase